MSRKDSMFFEEIGIYYFLKKSLKFYLFSCIILLSSSIIHGGQDIVINVDVGEEVAGNGRGDNGKRPFDLDANGNSIKLEGNASVTGNYGARNGADVTNNKASDRYYRKCNRRCVWREE